MAIGDRVKECIDKCQDRDPVNAFIQLCIAIDGTAKKEYPDEGATSRCKKFLKDNLSFIMWTMTNGTPNNIQSLEFQFSDEGKPAGYTSFEDVVYSAIRCSLLHEGELPDKIEFTQDELLGMKEGRMKFPVALIGAILFAVISSSSNSRERIPDKYDFQFGKKLIKVNELWGDREKMRSAIRHGFQPDIERLLEIYKKPIVAE